MNKIPEIQNQEQQLDKLAAQRQIYSVAKNVVVLQMLLVVGTIALWLILAFFNSHLKIYAAYWGIIITLLDIFILTSWIDSLKEKAAKIQEFFDCDVLKLSWYDLKVGQHPDPEIIVKYSLKHYRKNPKGRGKLKDWYPVAIQELRMPLARLVCQRSNLWWDAELRRCYALAVAVIIGILGLGGVFVGVYKDFTQEKFLMAIIVPLMPAVFWGIRQYKAHNASASRQERLKEYVNKLWDDTLEGKLSDTQLEVESRNLQNEIYENRSNNPLIFDWIYKILRNKQEVQMNKSAEMLLKEVKESDRKSKCS